MSAAVIKLPAWEARLRRDMLAHGQRESARQFIAGTDRMLDDMGRAQDHVIVLVSIHALRRPNENNRRFDCPSNRPRFRRVRERS